MKKLYSSKTCLRMAGGGMHPSHPPPEFAPDGGLTPDSLPVRTSLRAHHAPENPSPRFSAWVTETSQRWRAVGDTVPI